MRSPCRNRPRSGEFQRKAGCSNPLPFSGHRTPDVRMTILTVRDPRRADATSSGSSAEVAPPAPRSWSSPQPVPSPIPLGGSRPRQPLAASSAMRASHHRWSPGPCSGRALLTPQVVPGLSLLVRENRRGAFVPSRCAGAGVRQLVSRERLLRRLGAGRIELNEFRPHPNQF